MTNNVTILDAALRTGSRAKNYAKRISELCKSLPDDLGEMDDGQREAIVRLATVCRSSKAVAAVLELKDVPAIESIPDFYDLFGESYFPVLENGKTAVGFWSVKDCATLMPDNVHEWVRDVKFDKKAGKNVKTAVSFGSWWRNHRPDYELYGVASDRALWREKIIVADDGRRCVNTLYGKPSVLTEAPPKYHAETAERLLKEILSRAIWDPNPKKAQEKRDKFIVDAGAHLLSLRDGGPFRCRKLFCFSSTNKAQGSGKSILQESIAELVPHDAFCTVPATAISGVNLLPLYSSSVCILTEAPSTATEKYTAENVKAFADAGWKTATEKFVASRAVRDNSLKMMSSNHLNPLPIDSSKSRRVEFFVALENTDNGGELRKILEKVEAEHRLSTSELRACIGWALLESAKRLIDKGMVPFATARRSIAAKHLLTEVDLDYFESTKAPSYSEYRDFRSDKGLTWSPDCYKFAVLMEMSKSGDEWLDDDPPSDWQPPEPPEKKTVFDDPVEEPDVDDPDDAVEISPRASAKIEADDPPPRTAPAALQYKRRMATAYLGPETMSIASIYAYVVGDAELKRATEEVRAGTADKTMVLRQVFPGATFAKFTRVKNIVSFTGFTQVDFDHVEEKGNGITPAQIRDTLAELPGFVIGGISSRADGAWGIFYAGDQVKDYSSYLAAERAIFSRAEEAVCMRCDDGVKIPTAGRTLAHDPDCRICDEALVGKLPKPYEWTCPSYGVVRTKPRPCQQEATPQDAVRNEKFMEAVVGKACEKIQTAGDGDRHNTAIKAIANVVMQAQERSMIPLSSWGRRLRDACVSVGLDHGEVNSIMSYWRQRTGLTA